MSVRLQEQVQTIMDDGAQLKEAYQQRFGTCPYAVARAPGRVNLIGEHIDYEGYGVLPMAISQACSVALGWQTPAATTNSSSQVARLLVTNVQDQLYPPGQFQLDPEASLPSECSSWIKYVHAAYKGCVEFAAITQQQVPDQGDITMLVHGNIPPGSGLSSSSALVVSSALALLALWGITATPQQLADFTCRCERYVGTQGGGMDQAVSVMAQQGVALHVEFNPVRGSPVPLPAGGVFVVANSLAPSLKADTAASRFNLRVLECRLAAMLLAKRLLELSQAKNPVSSSSVGSSNDSSSSWHDVNVLQQVEAGLLQLETQLVQQQQQQNLGQTAVQCDVTQPLTQAVQQLLPDAFYTFTKVCQLLGTSQADLLALLPPALQQAAAGADKLCLQQRALHVFSESQRVLQCKAVCCGHSLPAADKLSQLGALMDASHSSCAGLYQCSCDELDSLVKVAKEAGALGARLTGAGWGGCIVALVAEDRVSAFMSHVQQQYYHDKSNELDNINQFLFTTLPAAGATVETMD